jgi:hypothetical protein
MIPNAMHEVAKFASVVNIATLLACKAILSDSSNMCRKRINFLSQVRYSINANLHSIPRPRDIDKTSKSKYDI